MELKQRYGHENKFSQLKFNHCPRMAVPQFSLKWDSYEANMKSFIGEINGQSEFTDVTLVTGDGQQMEVHRMILSAFSPVLRTMFGQKSSPSTLLFLRGVSSKCLTAILGFMYLGEVNILEEDLPELLAVAKDLQLKGLTHGDPHVAPGAPQLRLEEKKQEKETQNLIRNQKNFDNIDDLDDQVKHDDLDHLDHQLKIIKDKMDLGTKEEAANEEETKLNITDEEEPIAPNDKSMELSGSISREGLEEMLSNSMVKIEGGYSCTNCDKQTFGSKNGRSHMKRHIEAKHIAGLEFNCPHCGQKFTSRNSVARHVMRLHRM